MSPTSPASADTPKPVALFITPAIWDGGRGRGKPTVAYTLYGFRDAGYAVHVVAPTNRPEAEATTERDGFQLHLFQIQGLPVDFEFDADHAFSTLVRGGGSALRRHLTYRLFWLRFLQLGTRRAHEVAREHNPALVYGFQNSGAPVAWRIGRRLGPKTVTTARIMGSAIGALAPARWQPPEQRGGLARAARRFLLRHLIRFDEIQALRLPYDRLILTDDGQVDAATLNGWLQVPTERLRLWRNGLDKAAFHAAPEPAEARARLGLPSQSPIVLWVSQLVDFRHPERLIKAMPAVLREHPDALFVLVGDGPEAEPLRRRAEALGVADALRFEGFQLRENIPLYYRAADVYAAFSDLSNLSNTLLEAMLSGTAIVTLDNGRTHEVIRHEANGLLLPPGRQAAIPDALNRLLGDTTLRAQLGEQAARDALRDVPTWSERIQREVDELDALVAHRRPSPS